MFAKRILTAVLLTAPLLAHDLYLRLDTYQPNPGATVRVEFHNGDKFPASEVPVKIERLRDMRIWTAALLQDLRIEGATTVADALVPTVPGLFVTTARTIPNFIELPAAKFEDYLKHEGLGAIVEWRKQHGETLKAGRELYSKYVKALAYAGSPTGKFDVATGQTLEFVPLANPYTLKPGQPLPVRLLFRGQPQPDQTIELAHAAEGRVVKTNLGRTNAQGEINVPLTGHGLWKLHTIVMERHADTKTADWESFWASFTFDLPAATLSQR